MTVTDSLIELFRRFSFAARAHVEATQDGDQLATNSAARELETCFNEVRNRGCAARDALLDLLDDYELPVALFAAVYSLRYSTQRAMARLRVLSKHPGLIGFGAQQSMERWRQGQWAIDR
jgi:signal transduction histidine kinase